ncbi:hypothetical protein SAMN05216490_4575 [Mucilaginibacter mallensis]|uniref:Uncharacterized protein n=1 Tax=Mucilaginibacter mallensis TaxID=652787 RepID=A0A1H2C2X5_MUCMA|nr:hypothetical protein [Mucilaginibacter mallensis]SDT64763.1 hypothetical protein SAMN05216490_4575 [Mucilaginibacter mallensis]
MGNLKEDINTNSEWIVKAFKSIKLDLDYTITSFIEIDKYFIINTKKGKAKAGSTLSKNLGPILFSIGSYIGNTIIKNIPGSFWITDDDTADGEITASVKLPDGNIIFPMQRVMKRFKNGNEDSIYPYGYEISKNLTNEIFNEKYWDIIKEKKTWWKF